MHINSLMCWFSADLHPRARLCFSLPTWIFPCKQLEFASLCWIFIPPPSFDWWCCQICCHHKQMNMDYSVWARPSFHYGVKTRKPLTRNCLSLLCAREQRLFISRKMLSSIPMTPSSINNPLPLLTPVWVLVSRCSVCIEYTHKAFCTPPPPPPPPTVPTRKALKRGTLPACNKRTGRRWHVMDGLSL